MKCPHCGGEITQQDIAKAIGSEGGKKSKRTLTPEQAKAMVESREKKRREKV